MRITTIITLLIVFTLHGVGQDHPVMKGNHPNIHKIVLEEVIQTTNYTYLLADEEGSVQWLAVPKMEAEVGETYYYQGGMQMGNFKSKELNREFESILFLSGVVDPEIVERGSATEKSEVAKLEITEETGAEKITVAEGGISLEELFINKEKYKGEVVKVSGKVTKYNSGIMGKNWIHIQDGNGDPKKYDLTITTQDEVKVKDIITVEGIIILDKDFGAGYFYDIIMESGKVVK